MTSIGMLSEEDQLKIESHLEEFLGKSESLWAALVDKGGNLFAQFGETGDLDLSILCALAAGSFAATHELARRLGEPEFTALYHEGQGVSIFISALHYESLLITVFDEKTNIGLVKFYAQQGAETLNVYLKEAAEKSESAEPLQLDSELDPDKTIIS
ncbi:MAG: roadblock/LC7 domain-containing protein [Verrucomicrobiota bacterium]